MVPLAGQWSEASSLVFVSVVVSPRTHTTKVTFSNAFKNSKAFLSETLSRCRVSSRKSGNDGPGEPLTGARLCERRKCYLSRGLPAIFPWPMSLMLSNSLLSLTHSV